MNWGTNLALRSQKLSYDPTRGKRVVQSWDGSRDAITVLALTLGNQVSWETDDSAAPMVSLTATSPDNDDLQTTWGIRGNQLTSHLYEHPEVENNVSDADLKKIKAYLQTDQSGADPSVTAGTPETLLYLMKHEQTHYIIPRFVLHMRSIGTMENCLNAVILDPDYVGCVFTQSQIVSGGAFDLGIHPTVQAYMAQISGPPEGDTPAGFTWGYLFQTPSLDPVPGGKHELRQEWWLGLWGSPFPYVAAS